MGTLSVRKVPVLRRLNATTSKVKVNVWQFSVTPSVSRTIVGSHIVDFGAVNTLFSFGKEVFDDNFGRFFDELNFHSNKFNGKGLKAKLDDALNTFQSSDTNDGGGHLLVELYVDEEGTVYAT